MHFPFPFQQPFNFPQKPFVKSVSSTAAEAMKQSHKKNVCPDRSMPLVGIERTQSCDFSLLHMFTISITPDKWPRHAGLRNAQRCAKSTLLT
jgi:hypothetical protein